MITFDLSKSLFHPRILDVVPPFMPGLFFEISLLFACPQQVNAMLGPARLERYLQIIIALFLAFVFGCAFIAWVRLIQSLLHSLTRLVIRIRAGVLGYFTNPKRFPPPMPPQHMGRFRQFLQKSHMATMLPSPELRALQQAWGKACVRVLKLKYGIDPPEPMTGESEWGAWQSVLGLPKAKQYRGLILVNATHATGWAGLAAARIAPVLKVSAYISLCEFFIAYGMIAALWELGRWNTRNSVWTIRLYSLLEEIPQAKENSNQEEEAPLEAPE